jgi:predicted nucleic acid-binding protein
MTLVFLDTNVILRYLTKDDSAQSPRALALLQRAARGELALLLTEAVVVETVNVLASRATYHLPRSEIQRHLNNVLRLRGLKIPQREIYRRALDLWVQTPQVSDFADVLAVAKVERLKLAAIASFDRDFDRFPQITRLEP